MPRYTKQVDGKTLAVETSLPREASRLKSEGFKETKARTVAVKAADADAGKSAGDSKATK